MKSPVGLIEIRTHNIVDISTRLLRLFRMHIVKPDSRFQFYSNFNEIYDYFVFDRKQKSHQNAQ